MAIQTSPNENTFIKDIKKIQGNNQKVIVEKHPPAFLRNNDSHARSFSY